MVRSRNFPSPAARGSGARGSGTRGSAARGSGTSASTPALETHFQPPNFRPLYITLNVSLPRGGRAKPQQNTSSLRYAASCRHEARLASAYRRLEVMPSLEPCLHSTGRAHLCHSCTRRLGAQRPTACRPGLGTRPARDDFGRELHLCHSCTPGLGSRRPAGRPDPDGCLPDRQESPGSAVGEGCTCATLALGDLEPDVDRPDPEGCGVFRSSAQVRDQSC